MYNANYDMKQDTFINTLKNRNVIVVSPHPDDALLSTGMLLFKLKEHRNVTVVNCFTKAHRGPYTFSARKFLKDSGEYSDATYLYEERMKEDKRALSGLHVKIVNLGLEDALFRRKKQTGFSGAIIPELRHFYPTYRFHIMKSINPEDYALERLRSAFEKFRDKNPIVFAPYGIGNHVDHLLARKSCEEVFRNVILYSDFPYNARLKRYGEAQRGQNVYKLTNDFERKNMLLRLYSTQFPGLFPDGVVPFHEEVYFAGHTL